MAELEVKEEVKEEEGEEEIEAEEVKTEMKEEEGEERMEAVEAEEVQAAGGTKRRRSGHQRQREAKWRASARQRTPSPW